MNCSSCGGKLNYENGIYVCLNCGVKQTPSSFYENTEVFLCYTELDEQGRRTRDSIVAQDLYNKLETAKIHTFYQRVSGSDLIGKAFETSEAIAFDCAKIIAVIATTPENFQKLVEKYAEKLGTKKLIPVYSGMNAYDMPQELKSLQAVNYDTVGAVADFTKNILRILGRAQEVDIIEAASKHKSKKKKAVIISVGIVLALILSVVSYIVFGTPHVLKSRKYEFANRQASQGNYIAALEMYSDILEYKDSQSQLKSIYARYNGYYKNEDNTIDLEFRIVDNTIAEIVSAYDNASFDITVNFNSPSIDFEFVDTKNKQGNGTLELMNDEIHMKIRNTDDVERDVVFLLKDKLDSKVQVINQEILLSWITKETTTESLSSQGYDVDFEGYIHAELGSIYSLKDSPVKLFTPYYDEIIALSAPASMLCPDAIGKPATSSFLIDDIIYVPNGEFPTDSLYIVKRNPACTEEMIDKATTITIMKKNRYTDDFAWKMMLEDVK